MANQAKIASFHGPPVAVRIIDGFDNINGGQAHIAPGPAYKGIVEWSRTILPPPPPPICTDGVKSHGFLNSLFFFKLFHLCVLLETPRPGFSPCLGIPMESLNKTLLLVVLPTRDTPTTKIQTHLWQWPYVPVSLTCPHPSSWLQRLEYAW